VTAGAPGGTLLTAPGNITLQGFTTTGGMLTVQNGGIFAVTGAVNLAGNLAQTGAGGVSLASSIISGGGVQFASPVTASNASITTAGGSITFDQVVVGSGSTSSLALNSGAGAIGLQSVSGLGSLELQTSGQLSLGNNIAVTSLSSSGVTGQVVIAGSDVSIQSTSGDINFAAAAGINGSITRRSVAIDQQRLG